MQHIHLYNPMVQQTSWSPTVFLDVLNAPSLCFSPSKTSCLQSLKAPTTQLQIDVENSLLPALKDSSQSPWISTGGTIPPPPHATASDPHPERFLTLCSVFTAQS